jgi:hypothetical protein
MFGLLTIPYINDNDFVRNQILQGMTIFHLLRVKKNLWSRNTEPIILILFLM